MQIERINAEVKIAAIASSIEADPGSWKGWSALGIDCIGFGDTFNDFMTVAMSVIDTHLNRIEGIACCCTDKGIYVVCKNAALPFLNQVGMSICEKISPREDQKVMYQTYSNLGLEGWRFSESVFNLLGGPFASTFCGTDDIIGKSIDNNAGRHEKTRNRQVKIMLVEDDPITRWAIGNSLKGECNIISVDEAGMAFSTYMAFNPDIIFIDIGLPDNNGSSVLEWIIRNDPAACVIMLSSKDTADNISSCIEKGAKGFVPKPAAKEDLLRYIHRYG